LTINVPTSIFSAVTPANSLGRRLAPLSLALLLLPFAGRLRRASKKLNCLLYILFVGVGLVAAAGLSGCSRLPSSLPGYNGPQYYTVTVTGTSGALSQTTTVTLIVE
jgi:hypothetical protein